MEAQEAMSPMDATLNFTVLVEMAMPGEGVATRDAMISGSVMPPMVNSTVAHQNMEDVVEMGAEGGILCMMCSPE